jgi:hypothetical protein
MVKMWSNFGTDPPPAADVAVEVRSGRQTAVSPRMPARSRGRRIHNRVKGLRSSTDHLLE